MTLAGKVAAVTGAGSGIGRGIAAALAAAGADVVANDVAPEGLDETLRLVREAGAQGVACVGDVRSRDDVQRIVDDASSAFGGLDIMVANAAVGLYADLAEMAEDDVDRILDINLKGALTSAQLAIPALRARSGGSIVFVTLGPGICDAPRLRRLRRGQGGPRRRCAGAGRRARRGRDPGQRDRARHDRHADARA